jgi:sulfhydrogenase subunit beta (sulfur reductase)
MNASATGAFDPAFVLAKENAAEWITRLQSRAEVIAPQASSMGDEVFATVSDPGRILWDFVNPLDPPKRFFLPQTEPIARITEGREGFSVEAVQDEHPRVLFNVRSCDLKGILFLRTMHAADLPDQAFLRRFDSFALVSLACTQPCPLGFCVCCDAGPFLRDGFDIQLTDLGDSLLAECGSSRGRALLEAGEGLFRPAEAADRDRRRELEDRAFRSFGEETCHFGSAMRRISTRRVEDSLWRSMAPWCLECGGCNLACPTCYCFSMKDLSSEEQKGGRGGDEGDDGGGDGRCWTRCRIWDSCQYAAFTLEASGHNPREAKEERMKRRFYHKVSAQYYVKDGVLGCVGCGRCVQVCLGTTDMPAVVEAVRKGRWEGGRP